MNKQTEVVTAILRRDAEPKSQKISPVANRANDPTGSMVDTRQTLGVHHSITPSRFRRGDWVVSAADYLDKTGVSNERLARQVVDVERHESGWIVGVECCEGRYEHECNYILLEHSDDWHAYCNNGTFYWTRQPISY